METHNDIVLLIISSVLLSFSVEAICVPRNSTRPSHPSPPRHQIGKHHISSHPPPVSSPSPPLPPPELPPISILPPILTNDPLLKKICDVTDNPLLCVSSVIPYLSGKIDPVSILQLQIKACGNQTHAALQEVLKLIKDPSTSTIASTCLQQCQETYNDALDNLQNAISAIAARDKGTLNSMLSAAMTDYETCEDGFAELPISSSPMAVADELLSKLASNCLAIATLIH